MTAVRGIRGATTVVANERGAILAATRELLEHIVRLNGLDPADVASAHFTTTPDIDADFPAFAAREIGWQDVPLICGREIPVPGALGRCVRVLVHWNTDRPQREVRHVFLHGARALRPRWAVDLPGDGPATGAAGAGGHELQTVPPGVQTEAPQRRGRASLRAQGPLPLGPEGGVSPSEGRKGSS